MKYSELYLLSIFYCKINHLTKTTQNKHKFNGCLLGELACKPHSDDEMELPLNDIPPCVIF